MSEQTIDDLIESKNLQAPRITPDLIDSKIKNKEFHKLNEVLTVCVITLENGFTVTGESACASPENFNQEIGEAVSFKNAREKIWALEGYLLKQKLYEDQSKEV
jgi:Phage protein (N4 Gp49/phage Sf6 gene 66) family